MAKPKKTWIRAANPVAEAFRLSGTRPQVVQPRKGAGGYRRKPRMPAKDGQQAA